jgi:hypothetical protein
VRALVDLAIVSGMRLTFTAAIASATPTLIGTALTAPLVAALIAGTSAIAAVILLRAGFPALLADLGHVFSVLAHGFATLAGDLTLLFVTHRREAALVVLTATAALASTLVSALIAATASAVAAFLVTHDSFSRNARRTASKEKVSQASLLGVRSHRM